MEICLEPGTGEGPKDRKEGTDMYLVGDHKSICPLRWYYDCGQVRRQGSFPRLLGCSALESKSKPRSVQSGLWVLTGSLSSTSRCGRGLPSALGSGEAREPFGVQRMVGKGTVSIGVQGNKVQSGWGPLGAFHSRPLSIGSRNVRTGGSRSKQVPHGQRQPRARQRRGLQLWTEEDQDQASWPGDGGRDEITRRITPGVLSKASMGTKHREDTTARGQSCFFDRMKLNDILYKSLFLIFSLTFDASALLVLSTHSAYSNAVLPIAVEIHRPETCIGPFSQSASTEENHG